MAKSVTIEGKRYQIDEFTHGYLTAAVWSSTIGSGVIFDGEEIEDGTSMDEYFEISDFSKEAFKAAVKDCAAFQRDEADDLDASGLDESEQGHLFWLNRNGHGVGFWDSPGGVVGNRLSKAAKVYGGVDLYIGDDGKIHGT